MSQANKKRKKSEDLLTNTKLIFAIREGSKSLKLYRTDKDEFFIVIKSYLLKFCYKKKLLKFNHFYEAEDFVLQNTKGFVKINYP